MTIEERIKRLEDVLAKLIWDKMVDQDFCGVSRELEGFRAMKEVERKCIEGLSKDADDHDPTPWCACCGSMTRSGCKCGPIARND